MTDKRFAAILHPLLVAAAFALLLAASTAAAQQQGQQGGFAPNQQPSPQQPQQQQPEPTPEPGPRQVPYLAELEEAAGVDRRVATTGGLVWRCEDDTCRAEGTAPRDRRQTARICGDLARRLGAIARFEIAGAPVQRRALDECNRAARFAGQAPVPGPDTPGQQGGFVPVPEGSELPEGVETAALDENRLTIVAPEGDGDGTASIDIPHGGEAAVEIILANPANEDGTTGAYLDVAGSPFDGPCAEPDWARADAHRDRGYVHGTLGSAPLHLGEDVYAAGATYYLRACPVAGNGGPVSGPSTNTVELALLATVAPGGIAMELPGQNILTVNGQAARVELLRPALEHVGVPEAALPHFSYSLDHPLGDPPSDRPEEAYSAAFLEVRTTPIEDDECPDEIPEEFSLVGDKTFARYSGSAVSDEPLSQLVDRPLSETYYVRACPQGYDGELKEPPTNTVEVAFVRAPDVEVVAVTPIGPPGGGGPEALYGRAYILEMTLRNNDAEREAEVTPAYRIIRSDRFHRARFSVGGGGDNTVRLAPGETKDVGVVVDLRPSSLPDGVKAFIRDHGALEVDFLVAPPGASGSEGANWEYVDADMGNNDMWLEFDVRRRFEVDLVLPWVEESVGGRCEDWVYSRSANLMMLVSHGEEDWHEGVGFTWRGDRRHTLDHRTWLSEPRSWADIRVSFILYKDGTSRTFARASLDIPPEEWLDGVERMAMTSGLDGGCPVNAFAIPLRVEARMLPIE